MKSKPPSKPRASRPPLRLDRGEVRGEVSKLDVAAVAEFKAQASQWAERIRAKPRQISIQKMRRKWASCSTRGTVSFSLEVLAQPTAFREFVIVHELLHLKVPNHGKLFKTLLRAYIPNYETIQPKRLP